MNWRLDSHTKTASDSHLKTTEELDRQTSHPNCSHTQSYMDYLVIAKDAWRTNKLVSGPFGLHRPNIYLAESSGDPPRPWLKILSDAVQCILAFEISLLVQSCSTFTGYLVL